jgi:hypothetical protein
VHSLGTPLTDEILYGRTLDREHHRIENVCLMIGAGP